MTTYPVLQFFLSAMAIVFAARWLTKACDVIARLTGLGHVFVGSIFLAASTSAPELFVDIEATSKGMPNLAAGDLLGSSLINLLIFCILILLFRPGLVSLPDIRSSFRLGILALAMTLTVGVLILIHPPGHFMGIHWGSYGLIAIYLLGFRFLLSNGAVNETRVKEATLTRSGQLAKTTLSFLASAAILAFMAPLLVESAESLSHSTGLGNSFVGTTFIAVTTSLPELTSSIVAARMGVFDMVLGNIVGSNAFNMLIFVAMDIVWKQGNLWENLSSAHVISAGFIAIAFLVLGAALGLKHMQYLFAGTIIVLLTCFSGFLVLYFLREAIQ